MGIIIPSTSPWTAPLVIAAKKTAPFFRLAIDYRLLNKQTKTIRFPLPNINDSINKLGNKTIFSNFDIKDAFHCIRIHKNSIPKTTFTSQFGNFAFTRAGFGFKNMPAFFSMCLKKIVEPLGEDFLITFLDD